MPEPSSLPAPVRLCASADLPEGGLAFGFSVREGLHTVPAFALRFEGQVVAYLNRCAHVPMEMDWQPGRFLDDSGRWILCATHGATYEPATGLCIAGPCVGRRLFPLAVREEEGQIYWYPSGFHRPVDAPD